MRRAVVIVGAAAALIVIGLLAWRTFAPRAADADVLSGYLEGEALYLATPLSGTLTSLAVQRGQPVREGQPLFAIDAKIQRAQQAEAVAQAKQAQAQARAAERAAEQKAELLRLAEVQAAASSRDAVRYEGLDSSRTGAVSAQEADRARTAAEEAKAQIAAAVRMLASARADALAARAAVDRARGSIADAEARLGQMSSRAPGSGRVEETFFQPGEWAAANQPIVSLIPDGRLRLRFYVPEQERAAYHIGRSVRFTCDGCGSAREAAISYVSPRPEYTPPVIYSRKARDRMVFLIEARPTRPLDLAPGQPVDVARIKPDARR